MRPQIIGTTLLLLSSITVTAQQNDAENSYRKHFIGSSLFMTFNLLPNPPAFYQLNYGYRFTQRNVLSVEAITWTYPGPIGRQYWDGIEEEETNFPGTVKAYGIGLAYKHFLWKNLYVAQHILPLRQHYRDEEGHKIQSGFQLFCTSRLGYKIQLFDDRFFIEPSVACTYWPINTNLPESFQVEEDKWPNYFLFEPGMHFGINF